MAELCSGPMISSLEEGTSSPGSLLGVTDHADGLELLWCWRRIGRISAMEDKSLIPNSLKTTVPPPFTLSCYDVCFSFARFWWLSLVYSIQTDNTRQNINLSVSRQLLSISYHFVVCVSLSSSYRRSSDLNTTRPSGRVASIWTQLAHLDE